MKTDFKQDFERLFGLVSDREKKRHDHRLEKQALRIKRSLSKLDAKAGESRPTADKNQTNFYGGIGEYMLLK